MLRRSPYTQFYELADSLTTVASRATSLLLVVPRIPGDDLSRPTEDPESASIEDLRRRDAECIHRILEKKGGRVYQTDVVKATDWSKAKVSRLLGEMEQRGEVDRFKVGRKKVVCYPQHLPECAKTDSPE